VGWLNETESSEHTEGWAVALAGQEEAIGSTGDDSSSELVLLAGGGKVPASLITGWRAACTCGWRGPLWRRARQADTAKRGGRWVYSTEATADPDDDTWQGICQEWLEHTRTADATASAVTALEHAAATVATAQTELDAAVSRARAAGTPWETIGRATGISRQSAHTRWAHNSSRPL